MATSFFFICVMATSFFYIYVMATSFFYIYIDIYIDIYKLTERPVILLNDIFSVQLVEFRHIKWEFPKSIAAKNIFLWPLSLSFP